MNCSSSHRSRGSSDFARICFLFDLGEALQIQALASYWNVQHMSARLFQCDRVAIGGAHFLVRGGMVSKWSVAGASNSTARKRRALQLCMRPCLKGLGLLVDCLHVKISEDYVVC